MKRLIICGGSPNRFALIFKLFFAATDILLNEFEIITFLLGVNSRRNFAGGFRNLVAIQMTPLSLLGVRDSEPAEFISEDQQFKIPSNRAFRRLRLLG